MTSLTKKQLIVRVSTTEGESAVARAMREAAEKAKKEAE